MKCPHCNKVFPDTVRRSSLDMHIRMVHRPKQKEISGHNDIPADNPSEGMYLPPESDIAELFENIFDGVCCTYYTYQRTMCDKIESNATDKQMAKVKMLDGKYASTNRRIYMLIITYIASRRHISEADATEMLEMIKEITKMHGLEIPLPSR